MKDWKVTWLFVFITGWALLTGSAWWVVVLGIAGFAYCAYHEPKDAEFNRKNFNQDGSMKLKRDE